MANVNKVIIAGYLGQDPELRYTMNGKAVCNLSVATNNHSGGEKYTQWHRVVVWGKAAENCKKYLSKGSGCLVEGRLQYRKWTTSEDVTRTIAEVHTSVVQFLSRASDKSNQPPCFDAPLDAPLDNIPEEDLPF